MEISAEKMKAKACQVIDQNTDDLDAVSKQIWSKPELAHEEVTAHKVLCDFLDKNGFKTERQHVLPTAFRAVHEQGEGPHVAVLCEYDALPEIGHACGHNLIAEVGIGAGIGVRAAMKEAGLPLGKLTVIGCPAEENGGGGKLDLIKSNLFNDIDVSLMAHPYPFTVASPNKFALEAVKVKYLGKASHAAGFPWEGINALDAAVMAYQSVSVLRQQMKPAWRVHGIILNGGSKPNIIPEETEMEFYIRAPTLPDVKILQQKVISCFEAAATATGCKVEMEWDPKPYANMINNPTLVKLYEDNANKIGIEFCKDKNKASSPTGSTDMGNVSHVVPSIHPMFFIGREVFNHTRAFTDATGDAKAQSYTLDQAKALAMTLIDILCKPKLLENIKQEFKDQLAAEEA